MGNEQRRRCELLKRVEIVNSSDVDIENALYIEKRRDIDGAYIWHSFRQQKVDILKKFELKN